MFSLMREETLFCSESVSLVLKELSISSQLIGLFSFLFFIIIYEWDSCFYELKINVHFIFR